MTRICKVCGVEKPLNQFRVEASFKRSGCRQCLAAQARARYWRWIEKAKAGLIPPEVIEYRKALHRRQKKSTAEKRAARSVLRSAIRNGSITKPSTCPQCGGSGRIHGHHEDYGRPLDVQWLCHPCHGRLHQSLNLCAPRREPEAE